MYGQYKKNPYGKKYKILSEKLASFFKRSQFCFRPATLVIAEVDVLPYCQCTTAPSWVYSFRRRHCSAICDEGFNFAAIFILNTVQRERCAFVKNKTDAYRRKTTGTGVRKFPECRRKKTSGAGTHKRTSPFSHSAIKFSVV